MKGKAEITHINLNDNTVEGIALKEKSLFSVQYHPESSPGPHDSRYLFERFVLMVAGNAKA
jgi:carbamoyl-phosphate synthase small subunit